MPAVSGLGFGRQGRGSGQNQRRLVSLRKLPSNFRRYASRSARQKDHPIGLDRTGDLPVDGGDLRQHGQAAVAGQAHLKRVVGRGQFIQQLLPQDDDGVGGIQVNGFAEHTCEFQRQRFGEIGNCEVRRRKLAVRLQSEFAAAGRYGREQRAASAAGLLEIVLASTSQRIKASDIQTHQIAPLTEAALQRRLGRPQWEEMNDRTDGTVLLPDGADQGIDGRSVGQIGNEDVAFANRRVRAMSQEQRPFTGAVQFVGDA